MDSLCRRTNSQNVNCVNQKMLIYFKVQLVTALGTANFVQSIMAYLFLTSTIGVLKTFMEYH